MMILLCQQYFVQQYSASLLFTICYMAFAIYHPPRYARVGAPASAGLSAAEPARSRVIVIRNNNDNSDNNS